MKKIQENIKDIKYSISVYMAKFEKTSRIIMAIYRSPSDVMENINIYVYYISSNVNNIYVVNKVKIFEFFCCLNIAFLPQNYK